MRTPHTRHVAHLAHPDHGALLGLPQDGQCAGRVRVTLDLTPEQVQWLLRSHEGPLAQDGTSDGPVVPWASVGRGRMLASAPPAVFLSSTTRDLGDYRAVAVEVIQGIGYRCVCMEDFGAHDAEVEEFCLRQVSCCDLFVGIVGHLHGSTPPRKKRSYTELEYQAALAAGLPRLMFVAPEDFPVPANLIEAEAKRRRQCAFRQAVLADRVCDTSFRSPDAFRRRLMGALSAWAAETTLRPGQ